MFNKRIIISGITLVFGIMACNLPGPSAEQVPPPSDVQTAAALTVEALINPLASATIQAPATPTRIEVASPTIGPTGTITPTYSVPILKVLEQTNCREGPGQDYEVVYTYLSWKELEIVGSYPQENYWIVRSDASSTGTCWLWGEYVEVSGSYWIVPTFTPPPTATPSPPAAPSVQKWDFYCNSVTGKMDMTIKWTDNANNETGYRIIRNNVAVMELPANSSTFTETISLGSGESVTYFVEIYNITGAVRSTPIKLTC